MNVRYPRKIEFVGRRDPQDRPAGMYIDDVLAPFDIGQDVTIQTNPGIARSIATIEIYADQIILPVFDRPDDKEETA